MYMKVIEKMHLFSYKKISLDLRSAKFNEENVTLKAVLLDPCRQHRF